MLYLNEKNIDRIALSWNKKIDVIEQSITALVNKDYAQPIKPYLRYKDLTNRIIAMPAYIGKPFDVAGIKWIASFPKNIEKGIKRANSVTILNNADTGEPECIINTSKISAIRTSAVSGVLVRKYLKRDNLPEKLKVGVTGFGPIAKLHIEMVHELLGDRLDEILVYDIKHVDTSDLSSELQSVVRPVTSWEETYTDADIFITCTVSSDRYIDKEPKEGALLLNVSLRDFKGEIKQHTDIMVVDDWEEVCRENTDIEHMYLEHGLVEPEVYSLSDVVNQELIESSKSTDTIMFNPMGMAIFDMAVAKCYAHVAAENSIGTELNN